MFKAVSTATQREAMCLTLGDRQAVEVRADAPLENGVTINDEVMRSDRRREIFLGFADIGDGLLRRDVFEDDAQLGQPAA